MTQADLVRLYFAKGESAYNSWDLLLQPAMSTSPGMCTLSIRNLQKTGTDQRLRHLSRCLPRQQVRTLPATTTDENGIRFYEYS